VGRSRFNPDLDIRVNAYAGIGRPPQIWLRRRGRVSRLLAARLAVRLISAACRRNI
jgi:hypothetical protein